jgi:hypothetical protein
MAEGVAGQPDVAALEQKLAPLSHGDMALRVLKEAMDGMSVGARQRFLNEHLLRAPIYHEDVVAVMPQPPDVFHVLQGDVVRTDAAYVLDQRQVGNPSYVIATSTCDLVPERRVTAMLLRVEPKRPGDFSDPSKLKNVLSSLVRFKSTQYLYLPPLDDDDDDVLFNVVHLDEQAQCANRDLLTVERRASMTLIGWRVYGALLRTLQVRETTEEITLRTLVL